MRISKEYTIWNSVTPKTVTSSTDATPIVMSVTSHGFSTGDLVMIYGHTTNVAANGIFKITVLTSGTFSLQNRYTGASVAGSGSGAGASGIVVLAPKILLVEDFTHAVLSVDTASSASLTLKTAGSIGLIEADLVNSSDTPNFGGTQSDTNPYSFIQIVNLDSGAFIDGSTGIVLAGTDTHTLYEVNTDGLKYLTVIPTAWTAGSITIKAKLFTQ